MQTKKDHQLLFSPGAKPTQSIVFIGEEVQYSLLNELRCPPIHQHNYNITFHTVYSYTDSNRENSFHLYR